MDSAAWGLFSYYGAVLRIETIRERVADHFHLKIGHIMRSNPDKQGRLPRQVAIYLAYKHTGLTLNEIAKAFRLKDHSSVVYARDIARKKLAEDDVFASAIDLIEQQCLEADLKKGKPGEEYAFCTVRLQGEGTIEYSLTHEQFKEFVRFLAEMGILF